MEAQPVEDPHIPTGVDAWPNHAARGRSRRDGQRQGAEVLAGRRLERERRVAHRAGQSFDVLGELTHTVQPLRMAFL